MGDSHEDIIRRKMKVFLGNSGSMVESIEPANNGGFYPEYRVKCVGCLLRGTFYVKVVVINDLYAEARVLH